MDEFADRASQTALRNNAFRRSREMSAGYVFASAYVKRSPLYDPYMDIVVVNGDGLAIAGCEGIIDYENGLVEIERVCTHDQYRKKGYATMAIHECIKRGIQRGVTKVQITGMNDVTRHMYSRFGESLVVKKHRFAYKK
jgi:GNAT superfamily N-acetyltransferase